MGFLIKIAYILTPVSFGGSERVSLNFLRSVDRDKFDVRPILIVRPWDVEPLFAKELRKAGFEYDVVPTSVKPGGDKIRVLRATYRIFKILKRYPFDYVHTQGYFADICGIPVARIMRISTLSTCHGYISNSRKLRFYNMLDRFVLKFCDKIIVVSETIKDVLVKSGINASRIEVLQNAVSCSNEGLSSEIARQNSRKNKSIDLNEFVVGYIGRLSEEKGLTYLIDAAKTLHAEKILFKLIFVGDGPEKEKLEKSVHDSGLSEYVVFAGFQVDTEDWLQVFDVFVLPSLTEGTPMALLEAMSMGVPVIATAVGGVPEVVRDKYNGILVEPEDSQALCEGIKSLKYNENIREQLIEGGQVTIKNEFSLNDWCRKMEKYYL